MPVFYYGKHEGPQFCTRNYLQGPGFGLPHTPAQIARPPAQAADSAGSHKWESVREQGRDMYKILMRCTVSAGCSGFQTVN
eukprot:1159608-Pelagomonas_calceolata.AAC.6